MSAILDRGKAPKMDKLKRRPQAGGRKKGYTPVPGGPERYAGKSQRQKANIDYLLGLTGQEKNKEQER